MGLFGKDHEQEELEIIEQLVRNNAHLIRIVDRLTREKENTKPVLTLSTIINNQTFIMADISLVLGGTPPTGVFTLLDNKSGGVVTATFTNQAIGANSNPSSATFALDGSNNVIPTAIAQGTGTIVLSASASYTDPGDGSAQTGDFSVTKNFTVSLGKDGVTLDVVFS